MYITCISLPLSLSLSYYQTLKMWLEEPRLHEETLSLPSLPIQYEPDRLAKVFKAQQVRKEGEKGRVIEKDDKIHGITCFMYYFAVID